MEHADRVVSIKGITKKILNCSKISFGLVQIMKTWSNIKRTDFWVRIIRDDLGSYYLD